MMVLPAIAAPDPLWDLTNDEIPAEMKQGEIDRVDGVVTVGADAWFGVPAAAFPDGRNFTVQISVSFPELVDGTTLNVLLKQQDASDDTGFGLACINAANWKAYRPIVNGMHIGAKRVGFRPDVPYTFTVTAKDGILSTYLNDRLGSRLFTQLLPNESPMWIGKKLFEKEVPFPAVRVSELKVYGPDFTYVSPHEEVTAEPRGAIGGQGWAIDSPTIVDPDRPKILIYGDSISGGYAPHLIPVLEGKVYVYHWMHFINGLSRSDKPLSLIETGAASADYDIVFFNNGLHSLHWTPEKATDEQIINTTRALLRGFRAGAPQAKLVWIHTTPHTDKRPAPGKPVEALGDKNDIVLRLNRLAAEVMAEEGVEIIDMYAPLAARLDLASGDGYHWSSPAYEMIAEAVAAKTMDALDTEQGGTK